MSYEQKYLKYKTKYLELKKSQTGGSRDRDVHLFKRKIHELLITGLYTLQGEVTEKTTLRRNSDGAIININFAENFPFKAPIIIYNGSPVNMDNWAAAYRNIGTILSSLNFNKKVLILCHPKKVTGTFEPLTLNNHWMGQEGEASFNILFSNYGLTGRPIFDTVDIKEGGTYVANAFSEEFITAHENEYDLVMVPDCDGAWLHLQTDPQPRYLEQLITISLSLTRMVKPGGIIQFSKFYTRYYSDELQRHLEINGFRVERKGYGLIAVKPRY